MKGYTIGVLMLNTTFHRPIGDIGNPATFPFPVAYERVEMATVERVLKDADPALLTPFVRAAQKLQLRGVRAITTSCGFLSLFQKDIQRHLDVPFFSSSLMQIPLVHMMTGRPVGILTARKSSLTEAHLKGVGSNGIPAVIAGMERFPSFYGAIVEEDRPLDMKAAASEMKQAALDLISAGPDIGSIILECTNVPPYRKALREVTELPIFDITTLTGLMVSTLK